MVRPLFRPAILDALQHYDRRRFAADLGAGLVVGVVAIPLALAFAIASGVAPEAGLVTAVVAGFCISALGGSRVQIGGPTGAFVVVVLAIVTDHSVGELLVATMMAGVMLVVFGLFRMGRVIKFIPFPVVTGFTAGIGAIIFLGQVPEVLGLGVDGLPGHTVPRLVAIAQRLGAVSWPAVALAGGTVLTIVAFKWWAPRVPGPVVAFGAFTLVAVLTGSPAETIGDRFGALRPGIHIAWPDLDLATIGRLFPPALTIAVLGAIESLLSAVVADGMTGLRHDSDQELMAQGVANIVTPLVGGIPATGAIARTATNVQNGATSPIAGIVHAAVVAVFVTVLLPVAQVIPLAVLAGILVVVAYNMAEIPRFRRILRMPRGDAAVLLATFGLTVLVDLVVAVQVGRVLAAFLFMHRMSVAARMEVIDPESDSRYARQQSLEGKDIPPGVVVYSIDGPFFFGAAEDFRATLERVGGHPRVVVFRMRHVPYMDATGLTTLESMVEALRRRGIAVVLSAVQTQPLELLERSGAMRLIGDRNVQPGIDAALARARELSAAGPDVS